MSLLRRYYLTKILHQKNFTSLHSFTITHFLILLFETNQFCSLSIRSVLASDRSHMAGPSHRESSHTVDFGGQNRCATQSISTLPYSGAALVQSTRKLDHNSPTGGLHSRKPHSKDCASCEDPPKARYLVTIPLHMARYIRHCAFLYTVTCARLP